MGVLDQLFSGPLVKLTSQQEERARKETWRLATEEGRAVRRAGLPIDHFRETKDTDINICWRMGWRFEDEEIKAREAKARR